MPCIESPDKNRCRQPLEDIGALPLLCLYLAAAVLETLLALLRKSP